MQIMQLHSFTKSIKQHIHDFFDKLFCNKNEIEIA